MTKTDKNNEGVLIDVEKCSGCLNCRLICSLVYEKSFSPDAAKIIINGVPGNRDIYFSEECNECNMCVKHCVYGTLTLIEEEG